MKLRDRFEALERTTLPPVWDEAADRASREGDRPHRFDGSPGRRIPKVIAALVVVAVFGSAFIGLQRSLKSGSDMPGFSPGQIARYPVPDAQPLAFGGGWTWVAGSSGGSTEIYRIDAATGTTTPLPQTRGAQWVTFGEGYAWALCGGDSDSPCTEPVVMKIDPVSGEVVDRIATPGPGTSIATGFGAVWVASGEGIIRIDPSSDRVDRTLAGLPRVSQVAVGGGRVWGVSLDGGRVVGFDPASGAVVADVPVDDPCLIAAGAEGVFVASCGLPRLTHSSDQLIRIDAATGNVDLSIPLPANATGDLALFEGRLWVGTWEQEQAVVVPLDPASGLPLGDPVELPVSTDGFGVSGFWPPELFIAGGAGSLWVTHVDANDVIRIGVGASPSPSVDTSGAEDQAARAASRAAALAESERLLALTPTPPGARSVASAPVPALRHPSQVPATSYLVDRPAWWTVPMSATVAMAWIQGHPPSGLQRRMSGSGVGADGPFSDVGYEDEPSDLLTSATLLIEVVPTGADSSAIRADGQAIWLPPRPVATLVPPDVRQAALSAYRGSPTNVIAQRTLTGVAAERLATLVNGLPVADGGTSNCGVGPILQVTFPTAGGPLVLTELPECLSVSVVVNGGLEVLLRDDAGLARGIRAKLGLPHNA